MAQQDDSKGQRHVSACSQSNCDHATRASSSESTWKFDVSLDGKRGTLTVSASTIALDINADKDGVRATSSREWMLANVRSSTILHESSTVYLHFLEGGHLAFRMATTAEVVRFGKILQAKLKDIQGSSTGQEQLEQSISKQQSLNGSAPRKRDSQEFILEILQHSQLQMCDQDTSSGESFSNTNNLDTESSHTRPGAYQTAPGAGSRRKVPIASCLIGEGSKRAAAAGSSTFVPPMDEMDGSDDTIQIGERSKPANSLNRSLRSSGRLSLAENTSGFLQWMRTQFTMASGQMVVASLVEETAVAQEWHPTVSAAAVEPYEDEKPSSKRRHACLGLVCLVTALVAVVLVLVLTLVPDNQGNSNSIRTTVAPTNPMDVSSIFEEVAFDLIVNKTEWEDHQSPASRAYRWIAEKDLFLADSMLALPILRQKVKQRFLLAYFYFHTTQNSNGWTNCGAAETGESMSCLHHKLESYSKHGEYFDQQMIEPSFRWLGNMDECRWAGVRCKDGIHVSELGIGGNGLAGSFPAELAHLDHMEVLDLQQNQLEGQLQLEYWLGSSRGSPSRLLTLRLDRNQFTGSIPEEWCEGKEDFPLEEWSLARNRLTGSLPTCLDRFQNLKYFSVLGNELVGAIPAIGGDDLETLHLSENSFGAGSKIPESVCALASIEEVSADCLIKESSTFVECECCTKCCARDQEKEVFCVVYPP